MIKECKNAAFEVLSGKVSFTLKVMLHITSNNINLETINCILASAAAVTKLDKTLYHQDIVWSLVTFSMTLGWLGPNSMGLVVGQILCSRGKCPC